MTTKTILVTGGAGYIGSHFVNSLENNPYKVIVLDNLVYGHVEAVQNKNATLIKGDINDEKLLSDIFSNNKIEAVLHFAAYTYVGESTKNPFKYYLNNVSAPLLLLNKMLEYKCLNFIFSSTCATYGIPQYIPLNEKHPQNPISPYGQSKLMLEKIIQDFSNAYSLNYVLLRYFNACGAAENGSNGEDHNPETHLIPLVLDAAKGDIPNITVFGTDYDTPDGTCIRDYIHVNDLASAHLKALEYLLKGGKSTACNLGTGKGASVKEVIEAAEIVTGQKIPVVYGERREGDPSQLVADPVYAKQVLQWEAEIKGIKAIVQSAWKWSNGTTKGKFVKSMKDISIKI